jgi:hypothetical protein
MADKDESDLVMVSNESETDSNPCWEIATQSESKPMIWPLQLVILKPRKTGGDNRKKSR